MAEETKEKVIYRFTPEVLSKLENKLPQLCVPKSELEAGVALGVQMVLKKLRDGFTFSN